MQGKVRDLASELVEQSIGELHVSSAFERMTEIMSRDGLLMTPSISLMRKAVGMPERVDRQLNPRFSLAEVRERHQASAIRRPRVNRSSGGFDRAWTRHPRRPPSWLLPPRRGG